MHDGVHIVQAGGKDDGAVMPAAQGLTQLHAVGVRQQDVQQDHVKGVFCVGQCFLAGGCTHHLKPLLTFQKDPGHFPDHCIILHQQDTNHAAALPFCQNSGILKLPYSSVYPIYDTLTTAFSEIHACISEEGVFMRHKTSGYFLLSALLVSLILGLCILLTCAVRRRQRRCSDPGAADPGRHPDRLAADRPRALAFCL